MNAIKLFFLLGVFFCFSLFGFAQKGTVTSATLTLNSIANATCFTGTGDVSVQLGVFCNLTPYSIGGYTLVLNKDGVYYTTLNSSTQQSVISIAIPINNLPPGRYDISGTAAVINPSNQTSYGLPSFATLTFFVGYQALWTETKEMAIQTLNSTVLQNVTTPTSTYAGARASNTDIGDFFCLITPFFNSSNATNRSVYVSLVNTNALVSFVPSTQNGYLEFRKGGSALLDGVYYKSTAGIFKLAGVAYTDKIRVVRSGSNLTFFKDQETTALASGSTNPYVATLGTQIYLTAFTTVISDGVNAITSFKCNSSTDTYATLFYEVDGYYYTVKNGKLRFTFNQNYDTQNNLKFNIYNNLGSLSKTQTNFPAVQVTYGDNYLTLDLTTTSGCLGQGFFVLEVISDKKEKMFLRFYNEYNSCLPEGETPPGGIGG
nr:hypothetical protein [uncultured Fluviicola sp.]